MAQITRRRFLKVSSVGALAAKTSGMAGIFGDLETAPAHAQPTTVHWLPPGMILCPTSDISSCAK